MTTFYDLNKDKILKYKKEFYKSNKQNQNYAFFKNIKISGYTKSQSAKLLKQTLLTDHLQIWIDTEECISSNEFIQKYRFVDYKLIEIEAIDETDNSAGHCYDIPFVEIIYMYIKKGGTHDLSLMVFKNQLHII